jgi:hypothetical protein
MVSLGPFLLLTFTHNLIAILSPFEWLAWVNTHLFLSESGVDYLNSLMCSKVWELQAQHTKAKAGSCMGYKIHADKKNFKKILPNKC